MTDPIPSASTELPSPEALAADLAAMLRTGVTVERCRAASALLALELVRAKAATSSPNDLAVSANSLIREACAAVDGIDTGAMAILLGIAPGWRGRLLKDRRRDAAGKLAYSVEHLRKDREPLLLEAVADELYAMDSAYRLRHRHRTEAERQPQESGLRIDWYEQHRRYGRLWTPIVALRADLLVMVDWMREIRAEAENAAIAPGSAAPVVADAAGASVAGDVMAAGVVYGVQVDAEWWRHFNERCAQMTWRLAQHSREFVAFVERDGGVFLMADAESEVRAVDALYRVGIYLPFGDANVSWFRRLLADVPHQELDEAGWVRRRPSNQGFCPGERNSKACHDRRSTPWSCVSALCGWCSSLSARSPRSRAISASTRKRYGCGCARPRRTPGRATTG